MTIARRITMERTYAAPIEDVWELWTTKAGIESWWGPDGFSVEVLALELRPGGELRYAMTAVAPPQVAFMKQHGMPLVHEVRGVVREVVPRRRLAYDEIADFIPGVEPYPVNVVVELAETPAGVHMVLTFDAMHDDVWTRRAVMGHELELKKLDGVIAARR